jgi:hypothetical protein
MREFLCYLIIGSLALIQLPSYVAAGEIDYSKPFPLSLLEYPISDAPYDPWTIILDVDNIQINSDNTTQVQNEEMVCINPANTANAVAIWRDFRLGFRRVGIGYTFDGGQTWHDTLLYVPPYPKQSDPVLTVDSDGNFFACTLVLNQNLTRSGIYVQKSTDGGVSWSDPVVAIDSVEGVFEDKQWITLDRTSGPTYGNIYISWTRFYTTQILLVSSTDGGESYSDPVSVSDEEGVQWSVPTVGMFGDVFVAWFQYWPTRGIFMDVSTDQGQTFSQDQLIVETNTWNDEINGNITVFPYPALTSDVSLLSPYLGNLYMAYMDLDIPDMDIFFIKSEDNGTTWSQPIRLNDDDIHNGADQFHPWLSVDETGVIHAIFYDRRLDPNNYLFDLYYTKSDDGGETWSPNERITNVSSSPGDAILAGLIGEYIGLDAWQGEVQMVWTDTRNGNQDVFSGRMSPTGIDDDIMIIPNRLRLHMPHPNPFNASVSVTFESDEEAQVSLEVVDILGRKAATLFDGVCRTGVNRFVWDGTDMAGGEVSSGTYFVRMSGPDGVQVEKAVLLR